MSAGRTVTLPNGQITGMRRRPNPGWPKMWMRLMRREKGELREVMVEVQPLSMVYSSSTETADMLEVTVADNGYDLINSPILLEDLKTRVEFTFGYDNDDLLVSPKQTLVFFRQRPKFQADGSVETTLVFYDMGVFLAQPLSPRRYDNTKTIEEVVQLLLDEVNTLFDLDPKLVLNTDDVNGVPHTYPRSTWRIHRGTKSANQFLTELRGIAREANKDEFIEIFIDGNVLYFRPARTTGYTDIGYYHYHSGVFGDDLLDFSPEVNTQLTEAETSDVDQETGSPSVASAGNTTPDSRAHAAVGGKGVVAVAINGATATSTTRVVHSTPAPSSRGDIARNGPGAPTHVVIESKTHVVTANAYLLESIAALYENTTPEAIADANGLDLTNYQLRPGQSLTVPILKVQERVTGDEALTTAKGQYYQNERKMLKATATVVGDPALKAGWPVYMANVGNRWSGRWYIVKADHRVGENGYTTEVQLVRNGQPVIGEGIEQQISSASLILDSSPKSVKDTEAQLGATSQASRKATAVRINGATGTSRVVP